jgi:hypothetical protein
MSDERKTDNTLEVLGKSTEVIASTDPYGICMATAFAHYASEQGVPLTINCKFPSNSPREFWVNTDPKNPEKEATINTLQSNMDVVYIAGIPFNNFGGASSIEGSKQALEDFRVRHPGQNIRLLNSRLTSPRDNVSSILVNEEQPHESEIESVLDEFYENNKDTYPINFIKLARFCAHDEDVLKELTDEEIKVYEELSLSIEIASRPSIIWHQSEVVATSPIGTKVAFSSPREEFNEEANRRLQIALEKLQAGDFEFFNMEMECFKQNSRLQIVTLGAEDYQGGNPPRLAFFDIGETPVGFHFTSLKLVQHQTAADYVVAISLTDKKNVMKIIGNWKAGELPDELETLQHLKTKGLQVTGNRNLVSVGEFTKETVDNRIFLQGCMELALEICPDINSVFKGVRAIAVIGNPNTGKSTLAYMLVKESNELAGVNVAERIDGDLMSPTSNSFLSALSNLNY